MPAERPEALEAAVATLEAWLEDAVGDFGHDEIVALQAVLQALAEARRAPCGECGRLREAAVQLAPLPCTHQTGEYLPTCADSSCESNQPGRLEAGRHAHFGNLKDCGQCQACIVNALAATVAPPARGAADAGAAGRSEA